MSRERTDYQADFGSFPNLDQRYLKARLAVTAAKSRQCHQASSPKTPYLSTALSNIISTPQMEVNDWMRLDLRYCHGFCIS